MHRLTLIPLAYLAMAGTPGLAQTMTGPRVEATIGYDRLSSHDNFEDLPDTLNGARLGGAVGYDFPLGSRLTLGVEGGAAWTVGAGKTTALAGDRLHQDLGRDLDVALRLGLLLSPRTLGYVKAGYANSRFDIRYDVKVAGGFESERLSADRGGLRLGLGVERNLGGRLFAKAEYRLTRYGNDGPYMEDVTRNQLLIGFGTRF
ncbi:outer membrane protein [Glacieibacterium frigidum]|uniref:Porin family protein n=1 Tax=Glacieibacterium frigidum TaxID=2593303 RepID=A0A552U7I4_9SPHN|nr:porin family protein [Glacieibacterium frigidum]TRW14177.1 porin family protein [Glacieibacterium frigidum]